jgi:hypothetical protein
VLIVLLITYLLLRANSPCTHGEKTVSRCCFLNQDKAPMHSLCSCFSVMDKSAVTIFVQPAVYGTGAPAQRR